MPFTIIAAAAAAAAVTSYNRHYKPEKRESFSNVFPSSSQRSRDSQNLSDKKIIVIDQSKIDTIKHLYKEGNFEKIKNEDLEEISKYILMKDCEDIVRLLLEKNSLKEILNFIKIMRFPNHLLSKTTISHCSNENLLEVLYAVKDYTSSLDLSTAIISRYIDNHDLYGAIKALKKIKYSYKVVFLHNIFKLAIEKNDYHAISNVLSHFKVRDPLDTRALFIEHLLAQTAKDILSNSLANIDKVINFINIVFPQNSVNDSTFQGAKAAILETIVRLPLGNLPGNEREKMESRNQTVKNHINKYTSSELLYLNKYRALDLNLTPLEDIERCIDKCEDIIEDKREEISSERQQGSFIEYESITYLIELLFIKKKHFIALDFFKLMTKKHQSNYAKSFIKLAEKVEGEDRNKLIEEIQLRTGKPFKLNINLETLFL